uniref:PiggyBac transposable element-derived protein 4-like n=1 Tax=Diabrotica virgifera virgifera TaxID=50390 RepID=A0A6P7H8S6_DIAVI
MRRRKNTPQFIDKKLSRGESDSMVNDRGVVAVRWLDTKEVLFLSNCHSPSLSQTERKLKTGEKCTCDCPEAVEFYNKYMGGVDLADQKIATYDLDRKSTKWWRKVFYKLLMASVINSSIIFSEIQNKKKKVPLLQYLVPVAEQLISLGRSTATIKRRVSGRP